jgi:hypothetical protein
MKWFILIIGLASVAVAVDKPATRSSTTAPSMTVATVEAEMRATAFAKVFAAARSAWEATPEYTALKAEADEKRAALESARAGNDSQAKLAASAAYNQARIALQTAEATAAFRIPEVRAAANAMSAANIELGEVRRRDTELREATLRKAPFTARVKKWAGEHSVGFIGGKPAVGAKPAADKVKERLEQASRIEKGIQHYLDLEVGGVSDAIATALWEGRPAIGMSLAELHLIGGVLVESETKTTKHVIFDAALSEMENGGNTRSYRLLLDNDTVSAIDYRR